MAMAAAVHNDSLLHCQHAKKAHQDPGCGTWAPIKDPNSPHVREIGEFAVKEYNRKNGASMEFISVQSGATQVVAGVNYRLVLMADDGANRIGIYQANVWEKPWEDFKELTSFEPILKARGKST